MAFLGIGQVCLAGAADFVIDETNMNVRSGFPSHSIVGAFCGYTGHV
jgi:UDP-N-acetyl-D-mannosaminuronic acid transferase (WecB/TagA/CpsF family)